jgi:DNA-binding transcriptional LysR family regulator
MLELRHLRYFVAVAEELNFSRAAERLHMAQPPLSVAIRQLEQELGTLLLTRTSREVRLTDAGRTFLDGARRTLAELEHTMSQARRAAAGELGRLRVAFSWSARFETLPALARSLRERRPEVELLIEQMWNAQVPAALRSGAIDAAVCLCPEIAAEISSETIRSEEIVALLPVAHPLAGEHAIALAALAADEHVLFPRDLAPRLHDFFVGLCRRAGFEPKRGRQSFHSSWDLRTLADAPVVGLAPASVACAVPDGVVAIPVVDPPDRLETVILWRSDDRSALVAGLREAARNAFRDEAATLAR